MRGLMESIGEADFLKWVVYHHERQEEHVCCVPRLIRA